MVIVFLSRYVSDGTSTVASVMSRSAMADPKPSFNRMPSHSIANAIKPMAITTIETTPFPAPPSYGTGAPPPTVPFPPAPALPFPLPLPLPHPSSSNAPINSGNKTVEFLSLTIYLQTVDVPFNNPSIWLSVHVELGSSV